MSCLDCFNFLFPKKYRQIRDLEEVVIHPPSPNKPKKPVINIIENSEDEIIYERKDKLDFPKNNSQATYSFDEMSDSDLTLGSQKLIKRKKKVVVDYSSDDSWDNSLILEK